MKKKGNEMESICSSSSSNARLLTNETESTCSSSSNARLLTKACNSVSASRSSNRTHIKRPRFHMDQLGARKKKRIRDELETLLGEYIPCPMFAACHANRDAFLELLLSACDGTDNTMGSPNKPGIFWKKFTQRLVKDLKLDIVVTEETVATCETFGRSLESTYLKMEKTSRLIEKHRSEQLCQPQRLKQTLYKVFGAHKPRFSKSASKNSTGSSSKSSRSSKSARGASRLSDARGPGGASQSLRQDVNDDWNEWEPRLSDALAALHSANLVTVAEVDLVSAQFRRSTTRVGLRLFLGKHLQADQVQYIRDMLASPPVV